MLSHSISTKSLTLVVDAHSNCGLTTLLGCAWMQRNKEETFKGASVRGCGMNYMSSN